MTKEKSNNNALKSILGAEAYLEYKTDLSSKADLKKQEEIVKTQTKLVIEKVEDKFERRLVQEFAKQNKSLDFRLDKIINKIDDKFDKIDDKFDKINDKFDTVNDKFDTVNNKINSQIKWIIGAFIGALCTHTSIIMGMIYFLHQ